MNIELCLCPFCKGKVVNTVANFNPIDVGQVSCPTCGVKGPEAHCDCEELALEESARLWNSPLLQFYMAQIAIEEEVERRR
jgi:hypothetical protein